MEWPGLYEDLQELEELVYIMIAQRAARGLGSLYAQANEKLDNWLKQGGISFPIIHQEVGLKTEKNCLSFETTLIYAPTQAMEVATSPESIYWKSDGGLCSDSRIKNFKLKISSIQINAIGGLFSFIGQHWK